LEDISISKNKSILWNIKKNKWIKGPRFPNGYSAIGGCALAINRSKVIFFGVSQGSISLSN
jgi:hypothetical protein